MSRSGSSSGSDIGAARKKKKKQQKAKKRSSSASSSEDKSEKKDEGEDGEAGKEPDVAEADVFGSDLSISSEEEAEAAKDEEVELWRPTLFN